MKRIKLVNTIIYVLVDDEDFEFLSAFSWSLNRPSKTNYAQTWVDNQRVTMHRLLMPGLPLIDHIDGNGLNNQKVNLRLATYTQNLGNSRKRPNSSSKYKGVVFFKRDSNWQAKIVINKKSTHLGYFQSEIDAARAYNKAALKHFGEFARLNEFDEPLTEKEIF